MNCSAIQSRIADLADGHLSPDGRRRVEEHLSGCAECREARADMQVFLDACHAALSHPGPSYTFADLRARMASIEPLDEVIQFIPKLRADHGFPRFAVAMVVAVLVLGAPSALRHAWAIHGAIKTPAFQFERVAKTYETYVEDPTILEDSDTPPWTGRA